HLLHQRPGPAAGRLPRLGADDAAGRDLRRVCAARRRSPLVDVALVLHGLPQPSSLGGPMTAWALLQQLREEGHTAKVVALRYEADPFYSAEREQAVRETGAELVVVPVEVEPERPAGAVPLRRRPTLGDIFPTGG